jgi:3',5'-cyclic AMP phosphodiesterase CpdA
MPTLRVLQVSDLHAGKAEEPAVGDELRALAAELEPKLVIATGDLAHRNRRAEHEQAAALLRSLGCPVLAVPGNHDMPMLPPGRFLHTFGAFSRVWGETEPVFRSDELVVCGLNSARPWLYQEGLLRRAQLERAAAELRRAPPGALRVVALHHHLVSAPWRTAKRHVFARSSVLAALLDAGAELIVSGHVHQSAVAERREFEVVEEAGGAIVAIAPGLGRPRPRRRGEARGLHVYEADEGTIHVLTYSWSGASWAVIAKRSFPRRHAGVVVAPTLTQEEARPMP